MKIVFDTDRACREAASNELRCDCGALLARWRGTSLELKCRRCKRVTAISLGALRGGRWVMVPDGGGPPATATD
jgi:hypothetical protein